MPRPFAFEQLSLLATNDEEREKLLEIGSAEGVDLYHDYIYREKRGWWEVLSDFKSLHVPLDRLIALLPRLQPRAFSIASPPPDSPNHHSNSVSKNADAAQLQQQPSSLLELCVAIVEYKTRYGRSKRGVCSSWLATCSPSTSSSVGAMAGGAASIYDTSLVPMWISPGTFPKAVVANEASSVVCIGPGTGVAPMRSILLARANARAAAAAATSALPPTPPLGSAGTMPPPPPPDMLFFGCRHAAKDYLFGEDFQKLAASIPPQQQHTNLSTPLALHCAFSRDEVSPKGGRCYVTHRVKEAGAAVWGALAAGGAVLVAGSAGQMPKDVHAALLEVHISADLSSLLLISAWLNCGCLSLNINAL
jgi:sulfite reductase alpha subunit-like flavoprotein